MPICHMQTHIMSDLSTFYRLLFAFTAGFNYHSNREIRHLPEHLRVASYTFNNLDLNKL